MDSLPVAKCPKEINEDAKTSFRLSMGMLHASIWKEGNGRGKCETRFVLAAAILTQCSKR
jgi:hypothetical protein